jgi:hypothetical protein
MLNWRADLVSPAGNDCIKEVLMVSELTASPKACDVGFDEPAAHPNVIYP